MGRKWWIVAYDLLHGELSVDLCSKSPTELVHDKFMRYVLLIAQCSSHVLPFPAPSLFTFWRQYSTSHGKVMLQTIRTSLHWLPLLTCRILEGKTWLKKSEVQETTVQAGWWQGLSLSSLLVYQACISLCGRESWQRPVLDQLAKERCTVWAQLKHSWVHKSLRGWMDDLPC